MTAVALGSVLPTYGRADVTLVDGDGCWVTAADGRRFLDFAAGIAVVALGHGHPAPLAAAHEQLDRLWHVSNLYWTEPMARLADLLSDRFGGAQAFFCNSGAEAIEAALKYARKATGKPGDRRARGLVPRPHDGRALGTGQPGKRTAFEPLVPGVTFAQLNDVASLEAAVGPDTGLILVEPVQGEGGVQPASPGFLAAAAELAAEHGALLCFDEVQTGVGRTGTFFAFPLLWWTAIANAGKRGRSSPWTNFANSKPVPPAATCGKTLTRTAACLFSWHDTSGTDISMTPIIFAYRRRWPTNSVATASQPMMWSAPVLVSWDGRRGSTPAMRAGCLPADSSGFASETEFCRPTLPISSRLRSPVTGSERRFGHRPSDDYPDRPPGRPSNRHRSRTRNELVRRWTRWPPKPEYWPN